MSDVLIVDDEKDIRELVADILIDEGYSTALAANSKETFEIVAKAPPKMIILDIWLKESELDGIDILSRLKKSHPDIPIVIISGHGNIEIAVAAIKQGAYDFIEKPFNIDQLMVVISRAMEASNLRVENNTLKRREGQVITMIGASAAAKALRSLLDKVASGNSRVMLTGGSGVGKEIAARYIHSKSNRASAPFVSVNCATIEPDKMELILFGSKDGMGLLEEADGGVLFLDEVADLPSETQSKILRVLVGQSFQRVGSSQKLDVDVRVISTSNKDLLAAVETGAFREELFHRLNVVPIHIPSLSERRNDIPALAEYFIGDICAREGLQKRGVDGAAMAHLQSRDWPGNVRQLRNVLERALILGSGKSDISITEVQSQTADVQKDAPTAGLDETIISLPLREARELFEKEYLKAQINRFGGNISKTSTFVEMERSALHRKLKMLNLTTSAQSGRRVAVEKQGDDQ